jgi:hypothetical protein
MIIVCASTRDAVAQTGVLTVRLAQKLSRSPAAEGDTLG